MRTPARPTLFLWLLGLVVLPASMAAGQSVSPELAVGLAVPVGDFGAHRRAGPLVEAGLLLGSPQRRVRYRLGIEGIWLPGAPQTSPASGAQGDVGVLSGLATLLLGPRGTGPALYGLVGGGVQRIVIEDRENPYGKVGGLRVGVGVRGRLRGVRFRAEAASHLILSDIGTGEDFGTAAYWPISVRAVW